MSDHFAMAARMINASICAYNIFENGAKPPPGPPVDREVPSAAADSFYQVVPAYQDAVGFASPASDYTPAFFACGSDHTDAALVGPMADGNVVVAIRGTIPPSFQDNDLMAWITDWINDAKIVPHSWDPVGTHYGHVEHGFGDATKALWPWIQATLAPLLADMSGTVLVTGHSKGGAMTYLVASLIRETWPELDGRIEVHAFAPAVAFDRGFLKVYTAKGLADKTTRYQVENDIVPFLPFWSDANVWSKIEFSGWAHELEWTAAVEAFRMATGGGYTVAGAFRYFDSAHDFVPDARVDTSALVAVGEALEAKKYSLIADAHSAVNSYLPCFSPVPKSSAA
ncbi:Lipase (class 3) [Shimia gijangensis]|uniref:Lipase (Class 3) n=1 Tax=Shimia gijangensis TaxID=1470563 RepID=A0A1M6TQC4_9RHOB|nr:lipase family protein [Shimia gijangensis]SHK59136.1 Lipase (class 3) [Shimia gijangensis]